MPSKRGKLKPTEERLNEIWPLLGRGLSDAEIGAIVGLKSGRVGELRRKLGVFIPHPQTRWNPEYQAKFEQLIADGWPAGEIAKELGFNVKTLLARDPTGALRANSNAAAGVRRWARKCIPGTYEIIYNSRIEED